MQAHLLNLIPLLGTAGALLYYFRVSIRNVHVRLSKVETSSVSNANHLSQEININTPKPQPVKAKAMKSAQKKGPQSNRRK